MSTGPGTIVDQIEIALPRPRPAHLGEHPEFSDYAKRIYATFEKLGIYDF
jgi:NitT/TauT family transport system ATP-binding protein